MERFDFDDETRSMPRWLRGDPRSPLRRIPYKGILYAFFLCLVGTICLLYSLKWTRDIKGDKEAAQIVFILGILAFLPGSYYTHIAFRAWFGSPGYNFSQIPNFN
eukprot:TRINITY_DN18993_c0_g1::TRINITY_DN18993_c0_g1_i1::g.21562::m.21562 TRINITY_DN18993_c0_g1::TRINITY_DN18993_c0_g1_i1::g.21562  ORF type:complete len:105 (-),score=8.96,sp/Q5BJP5/TM230_RAT/43.75/1e-09,DUF872/PF05915.7/7.2e-18,ATP1G1_PLM_MAT8/PF02038.11/3.8e+03,ATP1G1_PLM_MAT8/PF02038.11/5.2,ATP1G1_PLM_MAT8/PF02038.11/43 TRINITY_DN18993_c0_g1_i1:175-489(-)